VPPPLRPTRTRADSGCCPHESHRGLYTKQPCLASPLQISIRNRRAAKALAARRSHPPDAANCESKGGPQNSCWAALPFLGSPMAAFCVRPTTARQLANVCGGAMDEEAIAHLNGCGGRNSAFLQPHACALSWRMCCASLAPRPPEPKVTKWRKWKEPRFFHSGCELRRRNPPGASRHHLSFVNVIKQL